MEPWEKTDAEDVVPLVSTARPKESYLLTHSVHSAWLIFILVKISPEVLNATWNIQLLCSSETAQTIPYEDGAL